MSTRYRGVRYRAPLEAKWAAFFHHLKWSYEYDPYGDGSVTFLIHGQDEPFFVQVTGAVTESDYRSEAVYDADDVTVYVGLSPLPVFAGGYDSVAGILGAGDRVVWCWKDDRLWLASGVVAESREFRRHDVVKSAWAKATNDIQAVVA